MNVVDLTGFGDLLRAVGVLFWLLVAAALIASVKLPKTRNGKIITTLVVVSLFIAFPGRWAWEEKRKHDAARTRYQKASAMFVERCKKSGEFIRKTAENVEGIYLLKIRTLEHMGDQYALDDQYGNDLNGNGYIGTFLRARNEKGHLDAMKAGGYRYIDAVDPKDGKRYRYTGRMDEPWRRNPNALEGHRVFTLDKIPAPDPAPRYGVTYGDISTREERDYWIAGSSLRVIDLQTNEVIAERIGYMWDPGQGKHGSGVAGWQVAERTACPQRSEMHQTRNFVEKVLPLTKEN